VASEVIAGHRAVERGFRGYASPGPGFVAGVRADQIFKFFMVVY